MKSENKGFSLIELMIVIAIIGILAAIAVPSYKIYVNKAKISKAFTYLTEGKTAVNDYVAASSDTSCTNLAMPTSPTETGFFFSYGNGTCEVNVSAPDGLIGEYGFTMVFTPTINESGISWSCSYLSGAPSQAALDFMPSQCSHLTV